VSFSDLDPTRLWRGSFQVALVIGVAACSATTLPPRSQAPGVAEMQGREEPATFHFWAPPGTQFLWTERRKFDAALVGTDVADHDETELRWLVTLHPSSSEPTLIDERLVGVSYQHDGRTVVSGETDALIQLAVDSEGTLESVSGVEAASRAVRALASPEAESVVDRMFSGAALSAIVRARTQLMLDDVVGRPTEDGVTWIVPQRYASDPLFKRYTVETARACDAAPGGESTACKQLHVWVDVQPRAAETLARSLIERYAHQQQEQAVAPLPEWSGGYHLWGTILVQPATLLPAGAELREAGHFSMVSGKTRYQVDLRAVTDDTFEYGSRNVAVTPRAWPRR